MAEVTLSPIPYNGGILDSHYCRDVIHLSGIKFLAIYSQRNPNYTFCIVFEVNNIKSNSPTINILRSQALADYSAPIQNTTEVAHRLYKFNNNDVLVFRQTQLYTGPIDVAVLNVDPVTNIVTRVNANTLSFDNPSYLTSLNSSMLVPNSNISSRVTGMKFNTVDNIVVVGQPALSNQYICYYYKWDPESKNISYYPVLQSSNSSSNTRMGFMTIQPFISNPEVMYINIMASSSTSGSWDSIVSATRSRNMLLTPDKTAIVSDFETRNNEISVAYVPYNSSTVKYVTQNRLDILYYDVAYTALVSRNDLVGNAQRLGRKIVGNINLENDKSLLLIEGGTTTSQNMSTPLYVDIINHETHMYSPGTFTSVPIVDSTHKLNQKVPPMEKINDTLIVVYTFTSTNAFSLTFLYVE